MTQIAGRKSEAKTISLKIGDTVDLPNNLGSIELKSVKRFVSLDVHHDPTATWVFIFAMLVLAGLFTGLFIPRRRVWIKFVENADGATRLEYAGLARGEDPGLATAVTAIVQKHGAVLGRKVDE
jgi:cytochrome c biogenesis protein